MPDTRKHPPAGAALFALSFLALFLELMMIRWVPSVVHLVAYYANLMLISSFLGLGLGALLTRSARHLFRWFPVVLAVNVMYLLVCQWVAGSLPGSGTESRFYSSDAPLASYVVLVGVFVFNTVAFIPLGQQIGLLFNSMRPLRAYMWDLGGSLCGTLAFGFFSYTYFSPVAGMALVSVLFIVLTPRARRAFTGVTLAAVCGAMYLGSADVAVWSPYYYVTVHEGTAAGARIVSEAPAGLRSERNPPIYTVKVNQDFYQLHGTIDSERYDPGATRRRVEVLRNQYVVPYVLKPAPERVLVLGSGGGMDVEAALLAGASHVDAVDVDPVLIELSREYNASGVYDDPRVHVHVNDARAYLQQTDERYDLIVFGYLDSQALSSYMSNLRLDGFTYTVEGLERAWELLEPDGMLALSFAASQEWLGAKLRRMILDATGREPVVYVYPPQVILAAARGDSIAGPPRVGSFERMQVGGLVEPATDDWPYLYLSRKTIPSDYLIVIMTLLVLSAGTVLLLRGRSFGSTDAHFFFLGIGFLLLQTKSIADCSLYFGTTWFVTMLVIAGVLLMVLLANAVALRISGAPLWFYMPLFASLILLLAVPREFVLSFPMAGRAAWTMLLVPLPLFFAGLIFSTTFREQTRMPGITAAGLFGANLLGATVGGFIEYLGMAIGSQALMLVVIGAYLTSLLVLRRSRLQPSVST